jgi:hypothetical protein
MKPVTGVDVLGLLTVKDTAKIRFGDASLRSKKLKVKRQKVISCKS